MLTRSRRMMAKRSGARRKIDDVIVTAKKIGITMIVGAEGMTMRVMAGNAETMMTATKSGGNDDVRRSEDGTSVVRVEIGTDRDETTNIATKIESDETRGTATKIANDDIGTMIVLRGKRDLTVTDADFRAFDPVIREVWLPYTHMFRE
jgi:hypothetical protein